MKKIIDARQCELQITASHETLLSVYPSIYVCEKNDEKMTDI